MCLLCVSYVIVVQVVVEDNIIGIPDVSTVDLNQVYSVYSVYLR